MDREGGRRRREERTRGESYGGVPRGLISHKQFSYAAHTHRRTVKLMSGRAKPVAC